MVEADGCALGDRPALPSTPSCRGNGPQLALWLHSPISVCVALPPRAVDCLPCQLTGRVAHWQVAKKVARISPIFSGLTNDWLRCAAKGRL